MSSMTEGTQSPTPTTPTTWRDVYRLVQDAEVRLTTQINDGFSRQSLVSADHEKRLRVVEATDQKQSGGIAALSAGRALLLTIVSVGSLFIAIASFVK